MGVEIEVLSGEGGLRYTDDLNPWLTESEQATPVNTIKDVVRSSVKVLEFDKHLKKAWRTYWPKRGNNNKDEDKSPKTLNDNNQQASSQKFRQLIYIYI